LDVKVRKRAPTIKKKEINTVLIARIKKDKSVKNRIQVKVSKTKKQQNLLTSKVIKPAKHTAQLEVKTIHGKSKEDYKAEVKQDEAIIKKEKKKRMAKKALKLLDWDD